MKKWANELNRAFFKGRSPNGKKTHEEMLNIPCHKGNANQIHTKILPTPVRTQTTNVGKDVGKRNPHKPLVGM
jgi:hypothetical protein